MSKGRTKIGVQRLTDDDLQLITVALKGVDLTRDVEDASSVAIWQRVKMILEKIDDEKEVRMASDD